MIEPEALFPYVKAALARKSFLDFCELIYPDFQAPAHTRLLAKELEAVESGETRRLIVSEPPRHGKSVLAVQLFPAWFLGRNPRAEIIVATHSATLSQEHSRKSRALLQDSLWPFATKLSESSSAVDNWHTVDGGGLLAVGTGGSVTGRGGNLILLDDLLHDNVSEAERTAAWRWYSETLIPRQQSGARIVLIGTRQADLDVIGRVLSGPDASRWKNITLPAIAEENDPLGREVGAALWPENISLQELAERRVAMGESAFRCQYQQMPVPDTGVLFKRDWLATRYRPNEPIRGQLVKVLAIDSAWRTGSSNDYSALSVWATNGIEFYLVDAVRGRWEYPALKPIVVAMIAKHQPAATLIEGAASGLALISELKLSTAAPIIGVNQRDSKQARVESILPLFEAGKVHLPEGAAWLDEWIDEHLRFPNGRHDDYVDTTSIALARLRMMVAQSQQTQRVPAGWMER